MFSNPPPFPARVRILAKIVPHATVTYPGD